MGRVICVCNQKGGVGKTTTCVNLSSCLALAEKRALVVDMDPQANSSSGLGVRTAEGENSVYQWLLGYTDFDDVVRTTALKHLHLVPSSQDLTGAEIELVGMDGRETMLSSVIEGIRDRFDYIFIDCPPSLGFLTLNALVAADTVLVPIQCEYYALEGVGRLIRTINRVKASLNPRLLYEGILMTMFDQRNNLSHQVVADVRKHFGSKVFTTIVPRNVKLSESPSFGKPVVLYDITSKGAVSYLSLSKEILDADDINGRKEAYCAGTGS
ncbi:MAG: AAA family ATPase [Pseudomonadota bacterium]